MSNDQTKSMNQIEREKAAFLYSSALERGDFGTIELILKQAQEDALLEHMVLEINEVLGRECDDALAVEAAFAKDAVCIEQILRECVPSGILDLEEDEAELPPLTVRGVLAQMQEDLSLKAQVRQEAAALQQTLKQEDTPLPSDLSQGSVQLFFKELGVSAGERLQKMFRQAAIFLAMGREQDMAQLAATRRQRGQRSTRQQSQSKGKK